MDVAILKSELACTSLGDLDDKFAELLSSLHVFEKVVYRSQIESHCDLGHDWLELRLIDKVDHVRELLPRTHCRPLHFNIFQYCWHGKRHTWSSRHTVNDDSTTMLGKVLASPLEMVKSRQLTLRRCMPFRTISLPAPSTMASR